MIATLTQRQSRITGLPESRHSRLPDAIPHVIERAK